MQRDTSLERLILELVSRPDYKPLKPRKIASALELAEDQDRPLKRALKHLVKSGHIAWGPKHLVLKSTPTKKRNEVIGRFRLASAGFGFVTPSPTETDETPLDVFIPERRTLDAANGDLVRAKFSRRRQGKETRLSGRVVEVIERRTHRFVGTYLERNDYGFVRVDGQQFPADIYVGDAGAKNCKVDDKVVIEMVSFPSSHDEGEAVIVEVLGDRGTPGVDTLTIVHQFNLPGEFSEKVLADARKQAKKFDESIDEGRVDFTKTTVVTIDPKTARDFDDAISLKQLENGHWELGVHIADVSHFVKPRSELDNEAFARGTSVYLPDKVIPMLPETISNNLASLQPGRVRYTTTAVIEFSADGVPIHTDLHRGAIKSAHRFNYEEIDDYLENDKPWRSKLKPKVFRLVRDMHTLGMILRKRRMSRGAFDLIIPDIKIDFDDDGKVIGAHTVDNTESHQIIEEFMLAANEAVARRLADEELNFPRRIHESPSDMKLRDLKGFLRDLGIDTKELQSRYELNRVIELAKERPERDAINFAVLRAMQKAIYSPRDVGHFALASKAYCHFTSPIRRYPDLIVHRMVADLISGKRPADDFGHLVRQCQHCSDLEQRAEAAERELIKLKLLNYMADKIGETMEAIVTGVESYGLFAQGLKIPAEGLVSLNHLPPDRYVFDKASRTLSGMRGNQYRLGDRVIVEIKKVDTDARQLDLAIVQAASKGRRSKSKTRQGKNSHQREFNRRPRRHK